jgi:hypothetical protein
MRVIIVSSLVKRRCGVFPRIELPLLFQATVAALVRLEIILAGLGAIPNPHMTSGSFFSYEKKCERNECTKLKKKNNEKWESGHHPIFIPILVSVLLLKIVHSFDKSAPPSLAPTF